MDIAKILTKLRITELNEMQQHAAEAITGSDGDVVLLSPTGTGKTLAYLLPLIQLLDATSDDVQALVITPGRELALQSDTVLKNMGCGLRSTACYGGRPTMDEHKVLKEARPQIVFGTPGRLNDHLDKENIVRYPIRYLVIDEFDKCLKMGFHAEMQKLIKSLPGLSRRILLSATNAEQIPQFVNMSKKGTLVDFLSDDEQTSERVKLYEVRSPQKDKMETLRQLLLSLGDESSIVFLNYRDSVERTNEYLRKQGFTTSYFHGGMEQRQREDMLYKTYVEAIKETANVWSVPVIDLNALCGLNPMLEEHARYFSDPKRDLLHPNAKGHERIARTLMYQLQGLPCRF